VLAVRLRRSGQREQLVRVGPLGGGQVLELRLAPGQGPGLVDQHDVDRPHPLERHPVLDQHADPGARSVEIAMTSTVTLRSTASGRLPSSAQTIKVMTPAPAAK